MTDTQDAGAGERTRWWGEDEHLTNGKVSYRVYHPDDLNLADYLNALEDHVRALERQLEQARALPPAQPTEGAQS